MKTDLFQFCGYTCVFQICCHIEYSTFTTSSFRIWVGAHVFAWLRSSYLIFMLLLQGPYFIECSRSVLLIIETQTTHGYLQELKLKKKKKIQFLRGTNHILSSQCLMWLVASGYCIKYKISPSSPKAILNSITLDNCLTIFLNTLVHSNSVYSANQVCRTSNYHFSKSLVVRFLFFFSFPAVIFFSQPCHEVVGSYFPYQIFNSGPWQ